MMESPKGHCKELESQSVGDELFKDGKDMARFILQRKLWGLSEGNNTVEKETEQEVAAAVQMITKA